MKGGCVIYRKPSSSSADLKRVFCSAVLTCPAAFQAQTTDAVSLSGSAAVSVSDGAAVSVSGSAGVLVSGKEVERERLVREWDRLLIETRRKMAAVPDLIAAKLSGSQAAAPHLSLRINHQGWERHGNGDGDWPYTNDYIWQGLKREKRFVTLAEGSEPNTTHFFAAQRLLSTKSRDISSVLPALALADRTDTQRLVRQLAETLKQLHREGDAAKVMVEAMLPPGRGFSQLSRTLRQMAQQSLLERYNAFQAECRSWVVEPHESKRSNAISQRDLASIWKSLQTFRYGGSKEKLDLLKAMTKCLRKIAKVVSKKVGPICAAETCVDELYTNMPAVVNTFRCKLLKSFLMDEDDERCRSEICSSRKRGDTDTDSDADAKDGNARQRRETGTETCKSDLEKIKALRELRDQIFTQNLKQTPTTFLGVNFKTAQALQVVSYIIQQMWGEEHKALLSDWYQSASSLLARSDERGLMRWIVGTLAEVGTDRSLHCLYSLFCQARNATLIVHKDLQQFVIYQPSAQQEPSDRLVQIHTPKGAGCRAINIIDPEGGKSFEPDEFQFDVFKQRFGLSLRPDYLTSL